MVDLRHLLKHLGAAFIAALWFSAALADDVEIVRLELDNFTVVHAASLPQPAVDEVVAQTEQAIRRVSAWLGQAGAYSGSPYTRKMRVLIDPDQSTPTQMRSTIYVPEGRVRAAYEAGALNKGDFGIVHEVTHVLAVSAYRQDRNRFYDDGLAVYLQQKFGPAGNYPVLGPEIHIAVADLAKTYGELIPLADADQARRESGDRRRLGYLQLGSFTQFLIENYGVSAYMHIYNGAALAEVTGLTMEQNEQRWRELIQSL